MMPYVRQAFPDSCASANLPFAVGRFTSKAGQRLVDEVPKPYLFNRNVIFGLRFRVLGVSYPQSCN